MIFRSKKKLTLPYRRIIFALSVFEIIFSISNILTLPMLPSSDNIWGSIGNDASCKALGFLMYLGMSGGIMYNLSLCALYVCTILHSMKQKIFEIKIEPFLHAIPILWSLIGGTILLAKEYFNIGSYNISCWISSYPSDCGTNEAVPCERGANYKQMRTYLLYIPIILTFVVIVITMVCVCRKVYKQEQSIQKYMFRLSTRSKQEIDYCSSQNSYRSDVFGAMANSSDDISAERSLNFVRGLRRTKRLMMKSSRNKAVMTQSLFFVLAYIVRWATLLALGIHYSRNGNLPFWLLTVTFTLNPLQGFMNLMMYVVPFIKTIRSSHREYSWMYAFIRAVISGGDKEN